MSTYIIRVIYSTQPYNKYYVGRTVEGLWSDGYLLHETTFFDCLLEAEARRDMLVRREYQGFNAILTVREKLYI
jgi:hypothetical protein